MSTVYHSPKKNTRQESYCIIKFGRLNKLLYIEVKQERKPNLLIMKIEMTEDIKQDIKENIKEAKQHVDKQLRKPIHHQDQGIVDAYMGYVTKMTQKLESNDQYL